MYLFDKLTLAIEGLAAPEQSLHASMSTVKTPYTVSRVRGRTESQIRRYVSQYIHPGSQYNNRMIQPQATVQPQILKNGNSIQPSYAMPYFWHHRLIPYNKTYSRHQSLHNLPLYNDSGKRLYFMILETGRHQSWKKDQGQISAQSSPDTRLTRIPAIKKLRKSLFSTRWM